MSKSILLAVWIGVTLAVAACSSAATAVPTATPTMLPSPVLETQASPGQQLFISRGCATCHGRNAQGTNVAPTLAGLTAAQVEQQVRAPTGTMPAFSTEALSDEELAKIIEFIEGLASGPGPASTPPSVDDQDFMDRMHGPGGMGPSEMKPPGPRGGPP